MTEGMDPQKVAEDIAEVLEEAQEAAQKEIADEADRNSILARIAALEAENARLREEAIGRSTVEPAPIVEETTAEAVADLAERVEEVAERIEEVAEPPAELADDALEDAGDLVEDTTNAVGDVAEDVEEAPKRSFMLFRKVWGRK